MEITNFVYSWRLAVSDNVVNILDVKSKVYFLLKPAYDGSNNIIRLLNAISILYFPPCIPSLKIMAPSDWDTLFLYGHIRFDPKHVGIEECVLDETINNHVFKHRSEDTAMQNAIEVFDYIKDGMLKCNYHLRSFPAGFIGKHTILTKESISKYEGIIGFYYLKDGTYERYYIKDFRKFSRNRNQPEKVKEYVSDASNIPITNKYILAMLEYFNKKRNKVLSISFSA